MSTTIEVRNIVTWNITTSWNFIDGETPVWTINGSNTVFTIANTPVANSEKIYINGVRQKQLWDYTISSAIITFTSAPIIWDTILVDYRY